MKPFIEYKGKTYEFEANFSLQKAFKKEYDKLMNSRKNNITDKLTEYDFNDLTEAQKELTELKNKYEFKIKNNENSEELNKELEKESIEILSKHQQALKFINSTTDSVGDEINDLNEKYCRLIFANKYPEENEEHIFDSFIDDVCKDKGIDYVIQLFSAIIKAVFMSVVEVTPQQKYSFAWEMEKAN